MRSWPRQEAWLREAGATEVWHAPRPFVEARHGYGGTRMGTTPRAPSSTASASRMRHPISECSVTSVFPSSGGHNPTLTLQALAWRTAQRLVDGWDGIAAAETPALKSI